MKDGKVFLLWFTYGQSQRTWVSSQHTDTRCVSTSTSSLSDVESH